MIIYGLISSVTITRRGFLLIAGEPVSVSGTCYGQPATEAEGSEARRFAIAHEFTAEDLAALPAGLTVAEALPADWRAPAGE